MEEIYYETLKELAQKIGIIAICSSSLVRMESHKVENIQQLMEDQANKLLLVLNMGPHEAAKIQLWDLLREYHWLLAIKKVLESCQTG